MNTLDILRNTVTLYVEDNEETRKEISEVLQYFTSTLYVASDGKEALEIFLNSHINLIISDINMPNMNGIEFVKHIREIDKKVVIVMLTAYHTEEYLLDCINQNIQAYIVKPISYDKLKDTFNRIKNYLEENKPIFYISKFLFYDKANGILIEHNRPNALKKKEILLMNTLIKNSNKIVTYNQIERAVWEVSDEVMTNNALRTVVKNLRSKTEIDFIKNISGIGYKLVTN